MGDAARGVHRDSERDLLEALDGSIDDRRIFDEVEFGEHHDGPRAAVEGEYEFALETTLVGGAVQAVDEEDDIDVGGQGVGLGPVALMRCPPHERALAFEHGLHPLAVGRRDDPVADGHIGTDVADTKRLVADRRQYGAPPAVEAHRPARPPDTPEFGPDIGEMRGPPQFWLRRLHHRGENRRECTLGRQCR